MPVYLIKIRYASIPVNKQLINMTRNDMSKKSVKSWHVEMKLHGITKNNLYVVKVGSLSIICI